MQRYYQIDLPAAPYSGKPRLLPVNVDSPKKRKLHVERFARYFLREMCTGAVQFESAESRATPGFVEYRAFLFAFQSCYVGSACFRNRDDQDHATPWLFDWLWIHPFFRRRRVLSSTWSEMQSLVGEFRLAKPISLHMQQFLKKVGHEAA